MISIRTVLVLTIVGVIITKSSVPERGVCDCEYTSGGCHIVEPAARGYMCRCVYWFLWTCRGDAIRCSDEDMEHPVPRHCSGGCETEECCRAATNEKAGDCGGY
ncbi:hypothetical protein ACHWQZ_G007555 [Mnemiopsis leidyi]